MRLLTKSDHRLLRNREGENTYEKEKKFPHRLFIFLAHLAAFYLDMILVL